MSTQPPEYPQDPYGQGASQPGGYGAPPPPPGGGMAPGGGMPPAPGGYGGPPMAPGGGYAGPQLASWGKRVQAALFDYLLPLLVSYIVLFAVSEVIGFLLMLATLAWALVQAYQGGATGQSFGKKQAGIRLVSEQTGQVIGGGAGIGRFFLHVLDNLPCYIGYLWPLWDAKRQTFSDKIMKTVVIQA